MTGYGSGYGFFQSGNHLMANMTAHQWLDRDHTRRIDRPEPGYYRMRSHSRGPWVPALILAEPAREPGRLTVVDRAPTLVCVVAGEVRDPAEVWTWLHPIPEDEYQRLCRETADVDPSLDLMSHPVRI